jgi:fructan beta-fructosidase
MRHLIVSYTTVIVAAFLLSFTLPPGKADKKYYDELYRPQFHFTPEKSIMGEPTGLIFYEGEYHLFYQYKPDTAATPFIQWGHAVSKDLIRWEHLQGFIMRDENTGDEARCTPGSGCAVVDEKNLTGLQQGSEKTMLIYYTGRECGQRLAYSNDRGRSWKKYDKNPLIPYENDAASGPYVFFHELSGKWVMTLYRRPEGSAVKQGISIYNSDDLLHWQFQSHLEGFNNSAELFQLPLDKNDSEKKWILSGAAGVYMVGSFDGKTFTPESSMKKFDYGKNFYAPRAWTNMPEGKLIQIAWMKGSKYPGMPFEGQMSFPCELSLRTLKSGTFICRKPIEAIASIYEKDFKRKAKNIIPGIKGNLTGTIKGGTFHILAQFDPKTSDGFGFIIRNGKKNTGIMLKYEPAKKMLDCLDRQALVEPKNGKINLEILVDRSSIEIFANDGEIGLTSCFNPTQGDDDLVLWTQGGELFVDELEIYQLKSVWPDKL